MSNKTSDYNKYGNINRNGIALTSLDQGRVHMHEQRELCKPIDEKTVDGFIYSNLAEHPIKPNVSKNYFEAVGSATATYRGPAYRASCNRDHFYVQANKYGTRFVETDWTMLTRFRVNAKWFDDLVARNKISRDQWVAYTLQKEPLALRHASHSNAAQIRWTSSKSTEPFWWMLQRSRTESLKTNRNAGILIFDGLRYVP